MGCAFSPDEAWSNTPKGKLVIMMEMRGDGKLVKAPEAVAEQIRKQLGVSERKRTLCVAVCVPVMDNVASRWVVPFVEMCFDIVNAGYRVAVFTDNAKPLQRCRNRLLHWALNDGADWVLWLDSDNCAPKDSWRKLMKHNLPLVSGIYFSRVPPFRPVPMMKDGAKYQCIVEYPKDQLIKVDATGLGFSLMKREVFEKLPPEPFKWEGFSEDIQFFKDAAEKGYECWIDTGIQVEHLGGVVDEACFEAHKAELLKDTKLRYVEVDTLNPMGEGGK